MALPQARRLSRFVLVSADAGKLAPFYEHALGCRFVTSGHRGGADFESAMGVDGGALSITLRLGMQPIELLQFNHAGQPYPSDGLSSDLLFQHLAVVVSDMDIAYRHLSGVDGWTAISNQGPQRLPASSGGVTAFKFRDPEGHPLELLAFAAGTEPSHWTHASAAGPFLGIDHSAISVSDTATSIAFYRSLGLPVKGGSVNTGAEQGRLDDLVDPQVEVTTLAADQPTPHLELLGYRRYGVSSRIDVHNNDIAATRLVWQARLSAVAIDATPKVTALVDPDGHRHLFVSG